MSAQSDNWLKNTFHKQKPLTTRETDDESLGKLRNAPKTPVWNISQVKKFIGNR